MPIYTYRCESCGVQFERKQHFSDEPLKICPECQTETLRKVYLPVGIVFKGSGFYSTDNRSSSGREPRKPDDHSGKDSKPSGAEKTAKTKTEKTKKSKTKSKED